MANSLYNKGKQAFLDGAINVNGGNIKIAFVTSGYTVDIANHQYVSDIGPANIAARSAALDYTSSTDGVFDAGNQTVEDYGTSGFDYIIIYDDNGDDATSELIAYIDTADGLPVPATTGTLDIAIKWSDAAEKIFSL